MPARFEKEVKVKAKKKKKKKKKTKRKEDTKLLRRQAKIVHGFLVLMPPGAMLVDLMLILDIRRYESNNFNVNILYMRVHTYKNTHHCC